MKPLLWLLQFAFGCQHRQLSGVFTIKKRTYQVCLECGQEFGYSWDRMHSIPPRVVSNSYRHLTAARPDGRPVI
jgi:hypothetical protein